MRVLKRPESNKKNPEPGKTYAGTIVETKYVSFPNKDGGISKGLKLIIKPDSEDLFKVTAFDWIGDDETGPFVYADSKMETWMKRILNVVDLSTVRVDTLLKKRCLFLVEKSPGKPDPKKPGVPIRDFYNVCDILCPPIESIVSAQSTPVTPGPVTTPYQAPQPAQMVTQPVVTSQPQIQATQPVKKHDSPSWADGEIL